jgi:hypothetical protein
LLYYFDKDLAFTLVLTAGREKSKNFNYLALFPARIRLQHPDPKRDRDPMFGAAGLRHGWNLGPLRQGIIVVSRRSYIFDLMT